MPKSRLKKSKIIDSVPKNVIEPEVLESEDGFLSDKTAIGIGDVDGDVDVDELSFPEEILEQESTDGILPSESFDIVPEVLDPQNKTRVSGKNLPVPVSKQIVTHDSLDLYLRELRKYPTLTREEEHELAVRFHKHKDKEALYRLVTGNLWLAVKIARDYEKAAKNIMDLIQEGNMGLLEAVKNFDPYRDVRLPSYAVWWIKAYIIRYLINNWRMVKIGTTQAQRKLFFNLKKEQDKLEKEGFRPNTKLIADRLNVKESEVVEMEQRMGSADLSVDAPLPNNAEASLLSVIPSNQATAHDLLEQRQFYETLQKSLFDFKEKLNPKERAIFEERLLDEEKATLHDLSVKLSISKERVRQIEERVKDKLKTFMLEHFGGLVEEWRGNL